MEKSKKVLSKCDPSRLAIRVGKVLDVTKCQDALSLYVSCIDFGEGKLVTCVSSLGGSELHVKGKLVLFLCNCRPAIFRGIKSDLIMLIASTSEKIEILRSPHGTRIGDEAYFEGYKMQPDKILRNRVWKAVKKYLHVDMNGIVKFKESDLLIKGHVIKASLVHGAVE